ncbi:alpha/beta fold hydrolase [Brevibacillus massiliensis]|uniref:alpha/beta fold hydrolase n=1 Tax=Brevibacillus massiliensis TaxID=1118054 RepID=UPI0003083757|nr:alpha/beta hydrolase [Brevibacillus massiliensis]
MIQGRYVSATIQNKSYDIYYETAGEGIPILCLHTAGADSRQYYDLLRDKELTSNFQLIAFDLPYHGRSMPADGWWKEQYLLTTERYVETIMAFIEAVGIESPIVMGCSMGGSITLELAYRYPERFRGVIGLGAAARTEGRFNEYLFHPQVNGGELCATNVYGLLAPQSPEVLRRRAWWIYSQGSPGIYYGDIYFYSEEWDATDRVGRINTEECPVFLLTGEYDYSCTPEMSRKTAEKIPGASFQVMKEMGHFPMTENPDLFKKYLEPVLGAFLEREREKPNRR